MRAGPRLAATLGAMLAAGLGLTPASAQTYPDRPVKMIVSYAAGNVSDVLGRLVAQRLSEKWGQPVVVENRPGIGGSLGADVVSKAASDGYTLLFTAVAAMAVNPQISPNVRYNPISDFAPVGLIAFSPLVLVAHPSVPATNLAELVALSKSKPGDLNWATPGPGTMSHLAMSYFKLNGGLMVEHVPYKASNALVTDLLAGRVQVADEGWAVVLPHVKAGTIRALAVGSLKRSAVMADVPAMAETFSGFESGAWSGVMAPAGTPAAIVAKINADIQAMLETREMQERLSGYGMEPLPGSPAQFARKLQADVRLYGDLARQTGMKME